MSDYSDYVAYFAELEAAGLIVKTGEFRRDRPVFVSARSLGLIDQAEEERRLKSLGDEDALRAILAFVNGRSVSSCGSKPNRFIAEVRGGVNLFLNRMTGRADGWWWGSDADPLQVGPFVSSEEALADASRDMGQFEVRRWDRAELRAPDRPLPSHGCIIVIDTGGTLWCKHGESPPAGWKPRQ